MAATSLPWPVSRRNSRWVYDVGNLWDLSDVDTTGGTIVGEGGSFRHVIGFSVFWDTPLGPLQFNVSDALKKESFDKEQSFEVTLRTTF